MCQFDWAKGCSRSLVKHGFWVHLWWGFRRRWASEPGDWVKKITLTLGGGGCHPICWEPDRKHGGRNGEFTLSVERECSSSPAPWHQCSWVFSLQTLTRTYTIQPLILRPMGSTGTVLLLVPLVLGLLDLNWMTLPSLVLQLLGSRSWDIAASITMLTNSYNQSLPLSVCLCIYLSI